METIKYFNGKANIEIEVSDAVAQGFQNMKREEWRREYYIRKNNISSNALEEAGFQFEDKDSNLQANIEAAEIAQEFAGKLRAVKMILAMLSAEQRKVIDLKFCQLKNDTEIGQIFGISRQAVQSRLEVIFGKIKKSF